MVTIKDVAKRAGVNPSTVSRSLKDSKSISEKTKAKVRQAMEELNYVPNVAASQLASGLTHSVGVIFPPAKAPDRLTQPFFMEILTAINTAAKQESFAIAIATGETAGDLTAQVELMHKQRLVDGFVVLYAEVQDPVTAYLRDKGIPFVVVGQAEELGGDTSFVDNDNQLMAQQAVDYLVEMGHERILFVTNQLKEMMSRERYLGYVRGCEAAGLSVYETSLFDSKDPQTVEDFAGTIQHEGITALVALDDMLALRLLQLLSYHGLSVPDDVSLISFNNSTYAKILHPYLTTFDIHVAELGQKSLQHLLAKISDKDQDSQKILVPFDLKVRESVRNLRKA